MKIAYLILAHNQPHHLQKLIHALGHPSARVFVHIDRKSKIGPFRKLKSDTVTFISKRTWVYWGKFSIVQATLNLMDKAFRSRDSFDQFILLSGTDYPLWSADSLYRFFADYPGREYINLHPMGEDNGGKSYSRLEIFREGDPKNVFERKWGNKRKASHIYRDYEKVLKGMKPYGGAQWWALTRKTIGYILDFVEREKEWVNFFKNTHIPDEMFFHTLVGNAPHHTKIRRGFCVAQWESGEKSPLWLKKEHIDTLFRFQLEFNPNDGYGPGRMIFARKFSESDKDVIPYLKEKMRSFEKTNRLIAE